MAKKLNEEYLKKLFELVGPGASKIKDWTAAAELVDESMEISRSNGARYQIVVSILKSTAFTGSESPIEIVFKGTKFDTITIKDADKAVKKFFDSGKKKSLTPVKSEEGKTTTNRPEEVSDTEVFFICFKAVRCAVRSFGAEPGLVTVISSDLSRACASKREYSFEEICFAIEKVKTDFKISLDVKIAKNLVRLQGTPKALKELCEVGTKAFKDDAVVYKIFKEKPTCFSLKEAFGHTFDKVFAAPTPTKKEDTKKSPVIFTDAERDKIFYTGGFLNDEGRASFEKINEYLNSKGKGTSLLKLESLLRQVPEFKIEGNLVYSASDYNQFRKVYRPIDSSNIEQVIFRNLSSLDWIKKRLNGCEVRKVDQNGDFNIYQVNIPVESEVAVQNFMFFIGYLQEKDIVYTDTKFVRWVKARFENTISDAKLKSDGYRYEVGIKKKRG